MRSVDCKVYSIPRGARSQTHENLSLCTLAKRLVLWRIDNDAYNGSYAKNPFHANHNDIIFLAVYVDGRQVPAKPIKPDFANNCYVKSYLNVFSSTGMVWQDDGNDLARVDFRLHLPRFRIHPGACDGACFHKVQKGNLRIKIHFAETINVLAYVQFESVLEILQESERHLRLLDGHFADRHAPSEGSAHQVDISRCRTQIQEVRMY